MTKQEKFKEFMKQLDELFSDEVSNEELLEMTADLKERAQEMQDREPDSITRFIRKWL